MITTSVYRLPANLFANTIMKRWVSRNWWIPILPTLLFVILGIWVNFSFIYVALMILLLVFPTVLMMVYFTYALSEAGRKHILPCKVSLNHDGNMILKYYPFNYEEDKPAPFIKEEIVDVGTLESITITGKYILIFEKKRVFLPRFIPLDAFATQDEADEVIKTLENGTI